MEHPCQKKLDGNLEEQISIYKREINDYKEKMDIQMLIMIPIFSIQKIKFM